MFYNSAQCLMEIVEALSQLAARMPFNATTALLLCRVTDGLSDYAAFLVHETQFRISVRPPLRMVATTDHPRPSRRGQPRLRLTDTTKKGNRR